MTISYTNSGFGRPNGPTVAQIREYSPLQTSSIGLTSFNVGVSSILGPASGTPGGSASSYYLIWGVTAGTSTNNALLGIFVDDGFSHTPATTDEGTFLGFGCTVQGPFMWSANQPIKITPGAGVKVDFPATPTGSTTDVVTITYSLIHP